MATIQYCPHCQQNVAVVYRPSMSWLIDNSFTLPLSGAMLGVVAAPVAVLFFLALFPLLFQLCVVLLVIGLLIRRSYCPICRTPGKRLQPQK